VALVQPGSRCETGFRSGGGCGISGWSVSDHARFLERARSGKEAR
jgi:hypothetical protein